MKRSGFKLRQPVKPDRSDEFASYVPKTAAIRVSDGKARMSVPIPKTKPVRSESYRRWVSSLPCAHCGKPGPSQCAHSDLSKGMSMKSSDDTCFPACADGPGYVGCHTVLGATGAIEREQRRLIEAKYAAQTRALWAARRDAEESRLRDQDAAFSEGMVL